MDTLKSKLPTIKINQSLKLNIKTKTNKETIKKEKYLDDLLSKKFIEKYFSEK